MALLMYLNFSEFTFLISMSFLQETLLAVILGIFMLATFYYLFLGLETIGRTSEIILPIFLFFLFLTYFLIILSGKVDFKSLTPVLEDGLKPVLQAVYPRTVIFPFGETIVFLMYCRYVNEKEDIRKTWILALGLGGLIVAISTAIIISVLGVGYTASIAIPLIEVINRFNLVFSFSCFLIHFLSHLWASLSTSMDSPPFILSNKKTTLEVVIVHM